MSCFNYQKICENILFDLPQKMKDVIERRFALSAKISIDPGEPIKQRETLESIGKTYGVTRERIRQIEESGFEKIKQKHNLAQKSFQYFEKQLKTFGELKREDLLLEKLGGLKYKPQVFFLLILGEQFQRFSETEDFNSLWTIEPKSLNYAKKIINSCIKELNKKNKPIALENSRTLSASQLSPDAFFSYIELSKHLLKGEDGLYGFPEWPEIKPKGIKDKAFLVLKKENKPMHFIEVANFIQKQENNKKPYLFKTVHNELIKDARFVLVGRGLYALRDWGYEPGVIKEIIFSVLKKAKKPLPKQKIVSEVLKQRFVKENTIVLNLNDKEVFLKDDRGRYIIKQA